MSNKEKKVYGEPLHNAVGYIRVSTQGQADKFGEEAQRNAIEMYALENHYIITKWYYDEVTGVSDDRPSFNELLAESCNPPTEAVIVFKSDRIARDMKLYYYYLYQLERRNVRLISINEDFGDSEFSGIYRALTLFFAEQERKNIALRTKGGRKVKAKKGEYAGGREPFGYRSVDGCLTAVPLEREIVVYIFKRRLEGASMNGIATELQNCGYTNRSGGVIGFSNVRSICRNVKLYKGYYKYGKDSQWIKGTHEPFLKPDYPEWDSLDMYEKRKENIKAYEEQIMLGAMEE